MQKLITQKKLKNKITMVTAYDFPSAEIAESAGVDLILVGDSMAMVVLGYKDTHALTLEEYRHHLRAVMRGVVKTPVIADLPIGTYNTPRQALRNARALRLDGCHAVKVEGGVYPVARALVKAGIPVMGHVGLTPQKTSDFKVRGRDEAEAGRIMRQALSLQKAGCFSIVLECIPAKLARTITQRLRVPTIGIGAGPHCDGQVLVYGDLIGLFDRFKPKFVRRFGQARQQQLLAVKRYVKAVREGSYPDEAESYH